MTTATSVADEAIRAALRSADAQDKLCVVSAVVGIDVNKLREIMNSPEPLGLVDRTLLIVHLQ